MRTTCDAVWLGMFCFGAVLAAEPNPKVINVKEDAPSYLYGTKASAKEGNVKRQNGDFLRWQGPGTLSWGVHVASAGEYEVSLCHAVAADAAGQQLEIVCGNSLVKHVLATTKGVFGQGSMAYEMIPLTGSINLASGNQVISLRVPDADKARRVMDFRCLELIPMTAKAAIQAERDQARESRANSEWLPKAGYGLMFHWTSQSIGKDGTHKPYAQAVADFDLSAFVKMVEATGAGYILFTVGHAEAYCPAPIKSWEKHHPHKTTERDLIAEMADALNAKGIKLMCYFPTHVVAKYQKVTEQEFVQINQEIMTEFGQRYGNKVAGYWFDGWYQCFEAYPNVSFRDFFKVCKAGNPNRIIAMNGWIYPNVTEWQEYWAGEVASPVELPVNGTNSRGPGKGLRYQALLIMEPYWVQEKTEMPKPRFSAERLNDYIRQCRKNGGAVTINLGIYQDGSVDPKAVEVLKEIHQKQ